MRLRPYDFVFYVILETAHNGKRGYQRGNAYANAQYADNRRDDRKYAFTSGKQIPQSDKSFKFHIFNYIKLGYKQEKKALFACAARTAYQKRAALFKIKI